MYDRTRTAGFGAEVKRRIMLGTYALSAGYYDAYYGKAQQVRTLILRDFEQAYEQFDLLLAPTSPTTAFELGAKTADPLAMYSVTCARSRRTCPVTRPCRCRSARATTACPSACRSSPPRSRRPRMLRAAAVLEADYLRTDLPLATGHSGWC